MKYEISYHSDSETMGSRAQSAVICDKVPQLLEDFKKLSEDHDTADIVFVLGPSEERVYAHRIILMARCKSFQNTKRGEICRIPGCTVSTSAPIAIRLPHIEPDIFRQFILYVYTAKIMLQDSKVFEMMILAQDMGVEELKIACEDHVGKTMSVANACTFLTAVMEIQEKASVTTFRFTFPYLATTAERPRSAIRPIPKSKPKQPAKGSSHKASIRYPIPQL